MLTNLFFYPHNNTPLKKKYIWNKLLSFIVVNRATASLIFKFGLKPIKWFPFVFRRIKIFSRSQNQPVTRKSLKIDLLIMEKFLCNLHHNPTPQPNPLQLNTFNNPEGFFKPKNYKKNNWITLLIRSLVFYANTEDVM